MPMAKNLFGLQACLLGSASHLGTQGSALQIVKRLAPVRRTVSTKFKEIYRQNRNQAHFGASTRAILAPDAMRRLRLHTTRRVQGDSLR
jgi:hypothetical protein